MPTKRITAYEMRKFLDELELEAQKSCRCDGGNTNCSVCIAERKIRDLQQGRITVQQLMGRTSENQPKPRPKARRAKVKWVRHGDYMHVDTLPCYDCGTLPLVGKQGKESYQLKIQGDFINGWNLLLEGTHSQFFRLSCSKDRQNVERLKNALELWAIQNHQNLAHQIEVKKWGEENMPILTRFAKDFQI